MAMYKKKSYNKQIIKKSEEHEAACLKRKRFLTWVKKNNIFSGRVVKGWAMYTFCKKLCYV